MNLISTTLLALLPACTLAPPIIVSAQISHSDGAPVAIARTNLRQTLILEHVEFSGELLTSDGVPIFLHHVDAGKQLYIDRDQDLRIESDIGEPLPPSAAVLFPRQGEAEALGLTFEPD